MIENIKTHLIVREIYDEFKIEWTGRMKDIQPKLRDNKPIFFVRGGKGCMELNTIDMSYIEQTAKTLTYPRGRASTTTDKAYIYIIDKNNDKKLLGTVTHNHIKEYNQMYDKFECV